MVRAELKPIFALLKPSSKVNVRKREEKGKTIAFHFSKVFLKNTKIVVVVAVIILILFLSFILGKAKKDLMPHRSVWPDHYIPSRLKWQSFFLLLYYVPTFPLLLKFWVSRRTVPFPFFPLDQRAVLWILNIQIFKLKATCDTDGQSLLEAKSQVGSHSTFAKRHILSLHFSFPIYYCTNANMMRDCTVKGLK